MAREQTSNPEGRTAVESSPPAGNVTDRLQGTAARPTPATRVAIVGAGRGGTALLELFHQIPSIEMIGIADRDPQARGLHRARELHIPVVDKVSALTGDPQVDLIVDVTGDPDMERFIAAHKRPGAEIVSGSVSRLLWELVQYETRLHNELVHAEKLAGIGSFAAGIAHDINNPLQLILGLAENLVDEQDPAAIREQTKDIIAAVKRASAISKDLTQYARRSSVRGDAVVLLNNRLDEALKIARYAASFHGIAVLKQYTSGAAARGNPDELLHIFVNLITNAAHAMDSGSGTLTLSTHASENDTEVRITDTGCGIAPEAMRQIFEPFYTTKEAGKGTGLGLYNVKTIVGKMGGTITVKSEVARGTMFTLTFPKHDPIQGGGTP
jgi:signal transduction histidine kinase